MGAFTIAGATGEPKILSAAQAKTMDINSIMNGWVDRGAWRYWDRVLQLATGTSFGANSGTLYQTYTPFSVGINKPDSITAQNKTKWNTNMPNSGQFNPPRCLVLQRLGTFFEPVMLLSDMELFNLGYYEFRIDDKIFFEGLPNFDPGGMGIFGFSTKNNESSWVNGVPQPGAMRGFGNYAKYIAPLQNFSWTWTFPSTQQQGLGPLVLNPNGTGLNVVFMMDGLTDRSVQ